MNFSELTSEIHNKLLNSSNPDIREVGKLLDAMAQRYEKELNLLKQQVAQLQQVR